MAPRIHSGWLTKSPPEKKIISSVKFFRAKWRKRFFVLENVEDTHILSYFKDQACKHKKGSINLDKCQKVGIPVESDGRTLELTAMCKDKPRTYIMLADTIQEANTWLVWLRCVCGFDNEKEGVAECSREMNPTQPDVTHLSSTSLHESVINEDSSSFLPSDNSANTTGSAESCSNFKEFIQFLSGTLVSPSKELPNFVSNNDEQSDEANNNDGSAETSLNTCSIQNDSVSSPSDQASGHASSRSISDYDVPKSTPAVLPVDLPELHDLHQDDPDEHIYLNVRELACRFNQAAL